MHRLIPIASFAGMFRQIDNEVVMIQPENPLLDAPATSQWLGLSISKLAKMRLDGTGPKYAKLGVRVVYRPDDVNDWLDAHIRQSTSDVQ
ncbi:MAG: DNA-binding protein [Maricaulis sp.]|nr:DNA-binding protein [Maricaulis sp.]